MQATDLTYCLFYFLNKVEKKKLNIDLQVAFHYVVWISKFEKIAVILNLLQIVYCQNCLTSINGYRYTVNYSPFFRKIHRVAKHYFTKEIVTRTDLIDF